MLKKNDIAVITIEDIGIGGEGIGKIDGYTLFVKDAILGDVAEVKVTKAKKNYGYGRLVQVVTPSPWRVEAKCPVARQCGGCQIQEMDYQKQLDFKRGKVLANLERIGGFTELPACTIYGMEEPFHYRNKAQFPVGTDKDGNAIAGFYAGRTHQIIPNTDCALGVAVNEEVLNCVLDYMKRCKVKAYNEETGQGKIRHILIRYGFTTKEIMVCLVVNGLKLPLENQLANRLSQIEGMTSISISVNQEKNNVIMGKDIRVLWGQGYITDYIGNVKYQISPLSFYQINSVQTEKLYGLALSYAGLTGKEVVWDVYCGIGTISLFLAQEAKQVYGVEVVPQAIEDARTNAKLNQMDNVEFFVGKAEEVLPEKYREEKIYADVIVVDPPRKGCDESVLKTMVEMEPERIVYVSCDSATLSRDLKYLVEQGYGIEKLSAVDMFPGTVHVESVCLLSKLKSDKHIDVELNMDELDLTVAESKATYNQIKEYVLEKTGLKISNLYIAQIKQKCGIIERENYNNPKNEDVKQPKCPLEKEKAIMSALKYFKMI